MENSSESSMQSYAEKLMFTNNNVQTRKSVHFPICSPNNAQSTLYDRRASAKARRPQLAPVQTNFEGARKRSKYQSPTSGHFRNSIDTLDESFAATKIGEFDMENFRKDSPRAKKVNCSRFSRGSLEFTSPRSPVIHSPFKRQESRRLFMNDIPKQCTNEEVLELFGRYGNLEHVSFSHEGCRDPNKKCGYLIYKTVAGAEKALRDRSNIRFYGMTIFLTEATPQKDQLFVGGYDLSVTKEDLTKFFSHFGEVHEVLMKFTPEGASRCFGFVTFRDSPKGVEFLVKTRFIDCLGKKVEVARAKPASKYNSNRARISHAPTTSRESLSNLSLQDLFKAEQMRSTGESNSKSEAITGATATKPAEIDPRIEGTSMFKKKYFAPFRRSLNTTEIDSSRSS